MTKTIVNMDTFANGAVQERLNLELAKALENIADLNTDPKKARTVQLSIKITPAENRQTAAVDVTAKTTLAPAKAIPATIILDKDINGKPTAKELKSSIPGQTYINEKGQVATDTGEVIDEVEKKSKPGNVVGFK